MQGRGFVLAVSISLAPVLLRAQFDFKLAGRDVQVHSFAQQGFAYSNNNNFLTMNTSDGTFAMTDGGINVSTLITDRFRVGAQAYVRNIGQLGDYHVQLDWAYGDYRFKDWFGIRAGKVKTALGLLNDTQDMEFLQTWAILPQSVYPLDLRSNAIAHTGVDVYGAIGLRRLGSLAYTGYYGTRPDDQYSGRYYSPADTGLQFKTFSGKTGGADLRWNTPIEGLMLGGSWADQTEDATFNMVARGNIQVNVSLRPRRLTSAYGDYARGRWHFSGEYRKTRAMAEGVIPALNSTSLSNFGDQGFFLTAAYRVTKFLELGAYNSRYYVDRARDPRPSANHIFDQTVTARVDIRRWWNVKAEAHFMDGYGDTYSNHGFYLRDNSSLKPKTNMLVLRMGFNM